MVSFNKIASQIALVSGFLISALAIIFHGIPFFISFYRYSTSEILAPLKFLRGELSVQPDLYLYNVLQFKSKILFVQFNYLVSRFLSVEPYILDYFYYFMAAFLGFIAVYLFLKKLSVDHIWALITSIGFVVLAPFNHITYGYHYKIAGGATLGLIAMCIMTILLYFKYSGNVLWHAVFVALLYFVHPLNAFLYLGFILFYFLVEFSMASKDNRITIFKNNLASFVLFAIFIVHFLMTRGIYGGDSQKIFSLISLINLSGGYWIPWLVPSIAITGAIFLGTIFILLFGARVKRYLPDKFFGFALVFTIYVVLLNLLHYLAFRFELASLFALDVGRVFALLHPIAFVGIISIIYYRFKHESSPNIAAISLFLLFIVIRNIYLFPLAALFLLFAKEDKVYQYITLLFMGLTAFIIAGAFNGQLDLAHLSFYGDRLGLTIWFFSLLILAGKFFSWQIKPYWLILVLLVCISTFRYIGTYRHLITEYKKSNASIVSLADYLDKNSSKRDIVITINEPFFYSSIRPTLVHFYAMAYGIYIGNYDKLERETSLVWDTRLSKEFVNQLRAKGYDKNGGTEEYIEDKLRHITKGKIWQIKKSYPDFRYILVPNDLEFVNPKLPLIEQFSDENFKLFEVKAN